MQLFMLSSFLDICCWPELCRTEWFCDWGGTGSVSVHSHINNIMTIG